MLVRDLLEKHAAVVRGEDKIITLDDSTYYPMIGVIICGALAPISFINMLDDSLRKLALLIG